MIYLFCVRWFSDVSRHTPASPRAGSRACGIEPESPAFIGGDLLHNTPFGTSATAWLRCSLGNSASS